MGIGLLYKSEGYEVALLYSKPGGTREWERGGSEHLMGNELERQSRSCQVSIPSYSLSPVSFALGNSNRGAHFPVGARGMSL